MPGEYGYSPEQMEEIEKSRTISDTELIKEGAEYTTDQQGNKQMVNIDSESKLVTDAAPAETTDQNKDAGFSQYEPSPAEKEVIKAGINRQLTLFLGDLYDSLPHDSESKVDAKEVVELIKYTRLNTVIPLQFWRKLLATAIEQNELNQKSKAEFISSGLAALDAMAGMQTIIEAGDRQLDESIAAKRKAS